MVGADQVGGIATQGYRDSVAELWGDVDELVGRTCDRSAEEAPSYALVPRSAIEASIRMNLDAVRDSLLAGRLVFVSRDVDALAIRVDERLKQGLRVEDAIQGWRISIGVIQERFVEIATARGVSAADMLLAARILWQLGDVMASRLTALFHSRTLEDALRDSHLRSEFLRELLAGQLPLPVIQARAEAFGLDPQRTYRAVKATSAAGASPEALRRRLETRSADLVGIGDGHCLGLLAGLGDASFEDDTIAVGPAVPLPEVARSFEIATRLHSWMSRRGARGMRRMEDVGWRLAVDDDAAVAGLLRERYRAPLDPMGEFGALIWHSVRAYMEADRNVARAAAALVVHQNTLRYRLARFADVTGAELDSVDTMLEVSWVLAAEEAA